MKIRSRRFDTAAEEDLLHLKRTARSARVSAGNLEDIAFLE
jgi:hypothetical protein